MKRQPLRVDAAGACTAGAYPASPQKVRAKVGRELRVRHASRQPQPEDLALWVMRTLALGLVLFVLVLLVLHG